MSRSFAELRELERIAGLLPHWARVETLCDVKVGGSTLPVHAIDFGPDLDEDAPVVGYFGGVHGLEGIGTEILLSHLESLRVALTWDEHLASLLRRVRVVFVPIVNPAGLLLRTRSNASGVDLMRNAPVESEETTSSLWIFRGHRLGGGLPWYRGAVGTPMEPEARAVCDFVRKVFFPARFSIAMDIHSGFFGRDRVWFPYARTRTLLPHVAETMALKEVIDRTYPNHRYVVEPQSTQYTAHGDLWDYLYDERRNAHREGLFLPLTLELGSSAWFKKNPIQLLDRRGMFHPFKQHRVERLLRRHAHLLELLLRLANAHDRWLPRDGAEKAHLAGRASALWAP